MLLRGSSHLGKKDFSKFALLPPFWGPNPQKFVSKMGKILHYSSPLSTTRSYKAEIWQECCLGGHLTWVKRIFRNSHFYPHFWAENSKISPQKCDTHNKLCSISESLGVRKLKIVMGGDYTSNSKCAKGFFEIHNFTPFLGPKPRNFASKMWIHHVNNNMH